MIVKAYTGGTLPDCDPVGISATGWTRPVVGAVVSGFRTADRPGHDGVDVAAPRNTVIRAASSGVVVTRAVQRRRTVLHPHRGHPAVRQRRQPRA